MSPLAKRLIGLLLLAIPTLVVSLIASHSPAADVARITPSLVIFSALFAIPALLLIWRGSRGVDSEGRRVGPRFDLRSLCGGTALIAFSIAIPFLAQMLPPWLRWWVEEESLIVALVGFTFGFFFLARTLRLPEEDAADAAEAEAEAKAAEDAPEDEELAAGIAARVKQRRALDDSGPRKPQRSV